MAQYFILIDGSLSMNSTDSPNRESQWDSLKNRVPEQICQILQIPLAGEGGEFKLRFFNDFFVRDTGKIFPLHPDKSSRELLSQILQENPPKGATYLAPTLKEVLEDCSVSLNPGLSSQAFVIIYTDGQLADRSEFVNLLSDTCRQLNSPDPLKIAMVGVGIDDRSEVGPELYQKIAQNGYKFKDREGRDCNIFKFQLLEQIPDIVNFLNDV
ncbi:MAG: VWA domain-containing protein [Oscillatoria princeps RMCB-10]|jgi:hypothetical protein|nr:VWA domain-containing protein [Oscillatoria princeps RMCB-10]